MLKNAAVIKRRARRDERQERRAAASRNTRARDRMALQILALTGEVAELAKDAERYRWLRVAGWLDDAIMGAYRIDERKPDTIDAAIDAAASKVE